MYTFRAVAGILKLHTVTGNTWEQFRTMEKRQRSLPIGGEPAMPAAETKKKAKITGANRRGKAAAKAAAASGLGAGVTAGTLTDAAVTDAPTSAPENIPASQLPIVPKAAPAGLAPMTQEPSKSKGKIEMEIHEMMQMMMDNLTMAEAAEPDPRRERSVSVARHVETFEDIIEFNRSRKSAGGSKMRGPGKTVPLDAPMLDPNEAIYPIADYSDKPFSLSSR
jgi:hypothetical protein